MAVALVTGSSTGIGKATVVELARNGYRVFASMRNPEAADPEMVSAGDVEVIALDVTDEVSMNTAVDSVIESAGQIDVLVNNAGIGVGGSLEEAPQETLRSIMETNFFGAWRMMQLVLPGMREQKSGHIANVTSICGRVAMGFHAQYTASKYALEGASESLAVEATPHNIRVSIIEPGVILTPIWEKAQVGEPPTESPYFSAFEQLMGMFGKRLEDPSSPELVAETIRHAIETDTPKLRYRVGADAEKWEEGRQRMSDEDYVASGGMTMEAFGEWHERGFGMDV